MRVQHTRLATLDGVAGVSGCGRIPYTALVPQWGYKYKLACLLTNQPPAQAGGSAGHIEAANARLIGTYRGKAKVLMP
jgi:hypothetical protein